MKGLRVALLLALIAGSSLVLLPATPTQAAGTFTYPGPWPCDWTLYQCVQNVPAGSTVRLALDEIDQSVSIDKSITLKPAPGHDGVIGGGSTTRSIHMNLSGSTKVVLDGLKLRNAGIRIDVNSGSHSVRVLNSDIITTSGGIDVSSWGSANVELTNNRIDSQRYGIRIGTNMSGGSSSFLVQRNVISSTTPNSSYGGIELGFSGGGQSSAVVTSNVVYSVAGCNCGGASGMYVYSSGTVDAEARVVNNTIDDSRGPGLSVSPPSGTAKMFLGIRNNSISNSAGVGVAVFLQSPDPDLQLQHDHNNLFGNDSPTQWGGYGSSGPEHTQNPQYVNAGSHNYRPQSGSILRNNGAPSTAVISTRDVAGNGRVNEAIADIGAYEYGSTPACTVFGTAGDDAILYGSIYKDIICGLGGDDNLIGLESKDVLKGGPGNDKLDAGGGPDYLRGEGGADELLAQDGIQGNDRLDGGSGGDTCTADPKDSKKNCP